jgi:hypothetical protein
LERFATYRSFPHASQYARVLSAVALESLEVNAHDLEHAKSRVQVDFRMTLTNSSSEEFVLKDRELVAFCEFLKAIIFGENLEWHNWNHRRLEQICSAHPSSLESKVLIGEAPSYLMVERCVFSARDA